MSADDYRRKARHFLALARQLSFPDDKVVMIGLAAFWMEKAEEADQRDRIAQQQQRMQPEKEPQVEGS